MKSIFQILLIINILLLSVNSSTECVNKKDYLECGYDRFCLKQECIHKSLNPISKFDIFVCFSFFLASTASILSGIGGGMVYSSLLVFICNFRFKEAIPQSASIVLVQNTIMIIYYNLKKHPMSNKNLIRFDNFLVILPNIFIGNIVGYFLYLLFPQLLLSILFCLIIILFGYLAIKKGIEKYLEESTLLEREKEIKFDNSENVELINTGIQVHPPIVLESISENSKESPNFILKLTLFLLSILIYFVVIIANGGKHFKPFGGVELCSKSYFIIVISHLIIQFIFSIIFSVILVRQENSRKNDMNMSDGEIKFSTKICFMLKFLGFCIGFLSILFGTAGGSINNIMLIALGFDPLNAVATSVVLIEISSTSSLLLFVINESIDFSYLILFCLFVIVSSITGAFILNYILNKFKRTSFFSFSMGFMYIFSLGITMVIIYKEFNDPTKSKIFEFHSVCPKK